MLYYCYVFLAASTVQELNQENALCILKCCHQVPCRLWRMTCPFTIQPRNFQFSGSPCCFECLCQINSYKCYIISDVTDWNMLWITKITSILSCYGMHFKNKQKISFNVITHSTCFRITDNLHIITFLGLCLTLKKTHMNEDRTEINW